MSDWRAEASKLAFGQKRKIHCCGSTPSALISNSRKGLRLHCFRCGSTEFEPHGKLSLQAIMRMRERDQELRTASRPRTIELTDAPKEAVLWGLRAGLRPELLQDKYGFGWSPEYSRVVVPVLNGEDVEWKDLPWICRSVDGRKPKYVASSGAAGKCWVSASTAESNSTVVLVEDVLSAIVVAESGYPSIALLGTNASDYLLDRLLSRSKVLAWFDPDTAGDRALSALRRKFRMHSGEFRAIRSDKDPKMHSRSFITSTLKAAMTGPPGKTLHVTS